jgi:inorganic triphosphatase YgiF
MSQEIELKLVFTQEITLATILDGIRAVLAVPELAVQALRNIYFDTADRRLNQEKVALRVRDKSGQFIQTLKTKGQSVNGLHQRGEWEWRLDGPMLNLDVLRQNPNWPLDMDPSMLLPVFETNFRRHAGVVDFKGSRIELAIDIGDIMAGNRRETLFELELELLTGDVGAVLELGEKLKQCLPLAASDISKAERGYRLAARID